MSLSILRRLPLSIKLKKHGEPATCASPMGEILPFEILEKILLHVCDGEFNSKLHADASGRKSRLRRYALSLPVVCRRWKSVVYGCGEFWVTRLHFVSLVSQPHEYHPQYHLSINSWKQALAHSEEENSNLDIHIHWHSDPESWTGETYLDMTYTTASLLDCISLLAPHSRRIWRMTLRVPLLEPVVTRFNRFGRMNRLEYLGLEDAWEDSVDSWSRKVSPREVNVPENEILDFTQATNLAYVETRNRMAFIRIAPPNSILTFSNLNITHNDLPFPSAWDMVVFRQVPGLETLRVTYSPLGESGGKVIHSESIPLPRLRRLEVQWATYKEFAGLSQALNMSNLTHLTIYLLDSMLGPSHDATHSFPCLRSLTISAKVWNDNFHTFLNATSPPGLKSLSLIFWPHSQFSWDFGRGISKLLPSSVPSLSLEFHCDPDWSYVLSRINVDKVTKLTLRRLGGTGGPRRNGFRLQWLIQTLSERDAPIHVPMPSLTELVLVNLGVHVARSFCPFLVAPLLTGIKCSPPIARTSSEYFKEFTPSPMVTRSMNGPTANMYEQITSLVLPVGSFDALKDRSWSPLTPFSNLQDLALHLDIQHKNDILLTLASMPMLSPFLELLEVTLIRPPDWKRSKQQTAVKRCKLTLERVMRWRAENNAPLRSSSLHLRTIGDETENSVVWSSGPYTPQTGYLGIVKRLLD